jgi:uncharacterized membrane protein
VSLTRDELARGTAHGDVYLRRLRRAQLALSLLALAVFAGVIGSLPLVIHLVPALSRAQVLGVPVSMALVIVPPLVLFVALGLLYERRADGLDRDFSDLVNRS